MDAIINNLKERSGVTTKLKVVHVTKMREEPENLVFFLILMADIATKIGIVMKSTDKEKFKLEEGCICLLKKL